MKKDRMALLIKPADKAAPTARAAPFGLSVSELMKAGERRRAMTNTPDDRQQLHRDIADIDSDAARWLFGAREGAV